MEEKNCHKCGNVLSVQSIVHVHLADKEDVHTAYICRSCDVETAPVTVTTRKKADPWEGVKDKRAMAREIAKRINKEGDYYKKGAFGFSYYQGDICAILEFEGEEPEVTPILDGFGPLDSEMVIDEQGGTETQETTGESEAGEIEEGED